MADFKASITRGMEAHRKRVEDHGEIGVVLDDLADAVRVVTKGTVEVERRFSESLHDDGASVLILVSTKDASRSQELARLSRSSFPLVVTSKPNLVECEIFEDFQETLQDIVSTASVGRMLVEVSGESLD